MKTNSTVNTSQADGEQVVRAKKYQVIKLGVDWHAEHYRVVRMIDGAGPEPAQRFSPEDFLAWAQKQTVLAERVFSCYEAGAGGFVLHRQLSELGVTNYVIAPTKLDLAFKGVCTDKTDARELTLNLDRYVRGNQGPAPGLCAEPGAGAGSAPEPSAPTTARTSAGPSRPGSELVTGPRLAAQERLVEGSQLEGASEPLSRLAGGGVEDLSGSDPPGGPATTSADQRGASRRAEHAPGGPRRLDLRDRAPRGLRLEALQERQTTG